MSLFYFYEAWNSLLQTKIPNPSWIKWSSSHPWARPYTPHCIVPERARACSHGTGVRGHREAEPGATTSRARQRPTRASYFILWPWGLPAQGRDWGELSNLASRSTVPWITKKTHLIYQSRSNCTASLGRYNIIIMVFFKVLLALCMWDVNNDRFQCVSYVLSGNYIRASHGIQGGPVGSIHGNFMCQLFSIMCAMPLESIIFCITLSILPIIFAWQKWLRHLFVFDVNWKNVAKF